MVWGILANCLTNKNQGITEFDIVEYPLRDGQSHDPGNYQRHVRKAV
jgi:hypothetical protein